MSTIIEKIQSLGIPITSHVAAAQQIANRFPNDTKSEYDYNIGFLTGRNIETNNMKHAQLVFGYVIQESVRMQVATKKVDLDEVVSLATSKAESFLIRNPWVQTATETVTTVVGGETITTSIPKKSKRTGPSKRDLCIALYDKHKDQNLSRAEMIALFVKELGLTPAGASTYVHNCKSGLWKK